MDEIFEFALREYLECDPTSEEIAESCNFALPAQFVEKANAIAAKAHVSVDAVVEMALRNFFRPTRQATKRRLA